ncbi:MAG: hypothetical protein ED558_13860 [Oricola sp.]|nr:MAG: hypothetical protein ED558_13860 [Oricola sp.]
MLVGPLTEEQLRRIRGYQDAHLTKRAAERPKPKKRGRKLNADRRKRLVAETCLILKEGQPTRFQFEGAARHGLRSALCLEGWAWSDADQAAAEIVRAALNIIGARRPTWQEGQPEHTQQGYAPVEYTRCIECGGKLSGDAHRNGWESRFCSSLCRGANYQRAKRADGEGRTRAEYWAQMAAVGEVKRLQRERPCKQCGERFIPRNLVDDIEHCSRKCSAKTNAEAQKRFSKCKQCGERYHSSAPGAGKHFCSVKCYREATRRQPKACEWCSKDFVPKQRGQRFCSARCSARARVARQKAL